MSQLTQLGIEMISSKIEYLVVRFLVQIVIAFQYRLDLHQQHLAIERLGDIIVGAQFISLYDIFLHRLCTKEEKRNIRIHVTYLFGKRKAVHMRHHDVEQTEIELLA